MVEPFGVCAVEAIRAIWCCPGAVPANRRFLDHRRVVELTLVGEDVAIGVRGHGEVALSDKLADPRPGHTAAAAENVEQLKASLLEAAGTAVKPVWITVECDSCGERSRIEAPVPDVRARVAAIELLLREGLGRPATADEMPAARMPASVAPVKEMSWEEMQTVFAATYAEGLALAFRNG